MPSATIKTLTLTPVGVSVFTDLPRQKSFVTLFFLHDPTTPEKAFAFPARVLDALTASGMLPHTGLKVHLSPVADHSKYRCHVKVAVRPLSATDADLLAWAQALAASLDGKEVNR